MCLLAPFILLALTCVGLALILATVGLVRSSADAGWAANWFGLAAMLPLTLLLSMEFGDKYGPSFLGWCHLMLFALAVLSILLGTVALSVGTARRRRWRNTALALAVLWLLVAVYFVVQSVKGARREREFYRPNRAERGIEPRPQSQSRFATAPYRAEHRSRALGPLADDRRVLRSPAHPGCAAGTRAAPAAADHQSSFNQNHGLQQGRLQSSRLD
jgi:hypothetical protein